MPTERNALRALPWRVMPCPTPPSEERRSTSTTSTPRWRSASDSTPPVMPPPTTRTRLTVDSGMGGLLGGIGEHGRARAGDPADHVVAVRAGGRQVGDLPAAVEDHQAVGDLEAQRQVVGDHDDRDPLVGHPADQAFDVLGLLVAERGRGLVQQQDALRLTVDADRAAGQRDDLALAAGEHLDGPGHGRRTDAEAVELLLRAAAHGLAVDEAQPAQRSLAQGLLAEVEVGRDVLGLYQ